MYATGNLPGWMGAPIRAELEEATGLPVGVENDANALAMGERYFGLAKAVDDFVCITLGTGVGGGCYIGGRLNRGAQFLANAIGHINVEKDGRPCTCGQRGCLEAYTNAAALVRYAGERFRSAEQAIQAANAGDASARKALRTYAAWLARGCAQIVNLLDPEMLVISGGIAQNNPALLPDLEEEMSAQVIGWDQRHVRIAISPLACFGGVIGAAAVALDAAADGAVRGLRARMKIRRRDLLWARCPPRWRAVSAGWRDGTNTRLPGHRGGIAAGGYRGYLRRTGPAIRADHFGGVRRKPT